MNTARVGRATLRVLEFVMRANADGGNPSVREIALAIGRHHTGVVQALIRLRNHGLVAWDHQKARTIHATCYYRSLAE